MGLGKTPVALTLLESLYTFGGETQPTLILGPLRVARKVWTDECRKWNHLSGLSVVPIIGTEKERLQALRFDAPVYTTNYDNLVWLIEHWGDRWPYHTVIADESDYIKGHRISYRTRKLKGGGVSKEFINGAGAKRAAAMARIAHTHIKRFIELTGTPAPNGLVDLWGQMWYLDRGARLGRTFEAFHDRWFGYRNRTDEKTGKKITERFLFPHADAEIHRALGDICLTIDGKDWFDLNDPLINTVYVDLPSKARKLYDEMEKEMFIQIEQCSAEAFNAAARTQKCLQIANGACYVDPLAEDDTSPRSKEWKHIHDEKLMALESIVHETAGAPLLVCYEFKSDLARLLKAFPKGRALRNSQDEDDFADGKIPLLFVHPKSAGHGIDGFQRHCCNIVFFGFNWSLGQRMQVIERIGPVRQMQAGFERLVTIHNIVARDTVDELVLERHESKREVQDLLLAACKRKKK